MPTTIYEACTNPISGEMFKTISVDKDAYVMQWTVQPEGYVPFEHIHLRQDEIFHIQKGEIKVLMDGREHIAREGETVTVPRGVAHIAYNNSNSVLDCIVSYKPCLDHDTFMQCFMGLTNDGLTDKKGGIDIPRMGYFLTRMKAQCMTRPTAIPAPLFRIALKVFYLRGVFSNWKSLFKRYTGK